MGAVAARVPVEARFTIIYTVLAVSLLVAGFAANYWMRAHTITRTVQHRVSIREQYGTPDTTVDGTQVNPQLKGFRCDVYQQRQTIVCHR